MLLTDEQKKRFAPMLERTYEAIAADANCKGIEEIIEVTCDAGRPEMFGDMSHEDYEILIAAYNDADTQKWLRTILNIGR